MFGVFILGIILVRSLVCCRLRTIEEMSSEKLLSVYNFFAKNDKKKGLEVIDELIVQFPKTSAAYQARLIKAYILTRLHNYNEALVILRYTEGSGVPDSVKPLANIGIIYVYDSKKDYFNAIIASKNFINKYPNHFFIGEICLNLAEYYFRSGLKTDAIKILSKALTLTSFPCDIRIKKAQNRLTPPTDSVVDAV